MANSSKKTSKSKGKGKAEGKTESFIWSDNKVELLLMVTQIEIETVSIFDRENKGLEIDNNNKWNENNTKQHCSFHDQAMRLEWFCKPLKQFIHPYDW